MLKPQLSLFLPKFQSLDSGTWSATFKANYTFFSERERTAPSATALPQKPNYEKYLGGSYQIHIFFPATWPFHPTQCLGDPFIITLIIMNIYWNLITMCRHSNRHLMYYLILTTLPWYRVSCNHHFFSNSFFFIIQASKIEIHSERKWKIKTKIIISSWNKEGQIVFGYSEYNETMYSE